MSAVIKTATPFVVEEVLMEALQAVGAEPVKITSSKLQTVSHRGGLIVGDILTNRSDYYGPQHFRLEGGRWILRHDSSEMNGRISNMLAAFLARSGLLTKWPIKVILHGLPSRNEFALRKNVKPVLKQRASRRLTRLKPKGTPLRKLPTVKARSNWF